MMMTKVIKIPFLLLKSSIFKSSQKRVPLKYFVMALIFENFRNLLFIAQDSVKEDFQIHIRFFS